MNILKRILKTLLIAVGAFVGLGALFFYGTSGMCTNAEGHVKWYTKGSSCSYVNYESCSLTKRDIPSGATAGCTDQQKITILQKDEIRLVGVAPQKTFSEACKENLEKMYHPQYDRSREVAISTMNKSWGLEGKVVAEACKPFVLNDLYQTAISDPSL